jgi:hypothetical protein
MKKHLFTLLILVFLGGCKKNEELLIGDITGVVSTFNQDNLLSNDQSDVRVFLLKDSVLVDSTLTDLYGQYIFHHLPYGKYNIDLKKENFLQSNASHYFNHVGGYSPTIARFDQFEIPTFQVTVDSIWLIQSEYQLHLFVRINDNELVPAGFYWLDGFAGKTPDVSKDNYIALVGGCIYNDFERPPFTSSVKCLIYSFLPEIEALKSDTIYFRFYPLALGQVLYGPISQRGLGKPSNVIKYFWGN